MRLVFSIVAFLILGTVVIVTAREFLFSAPQSTSLSIPTAAPSKPSNQNPDFREKETVHLSALSDWKSFQDQENQFKIKIPSDFQITSTIHGDYVIKRLNSTEAFPIPYLLIRVSPLLYNTFYNPQAKHLNEYAQDYRAALDIVIQHSEPLFLNGVSALRQFYSAGTLREDGTLVFDSLPSKERGARYVFWNGRDRFIIIDASQFANTKGNRETEKLNEESENLLDSVAKTFEFL